MIRSTAFLLCVVATALADLTSEGILSYLDKAEELSKLTPDVELPCSNDFNLLITHALVGNHMADLKKSLTGVTEGEAKAKWLKFIIGYCLEDKVTPPSENILPDCTKEQLQEYFPVDDKSLEKLSAFKNFAKDSQSMAISMLDYGEETLRQKISQLSTPISDHCMEKIDKWETRQKKELNEHFDTILSGIDEAKKNIQERTGNITDLTITVGTMKAGLILVCHRSGPIVYENYDALIYLLNRCDEDEKADSQK